MWSKAFWRLDTHRHYWVARSPHWPWGILPCNHIPRKCVLSSYQKPCSSIRLWPYGQIYGPHDKTFISQQAVESLSCNTQLILNSWTKRLFYQPPASLWTPWKRPLACPFTYWTWCHSFHFTYISSPNPPIFWPLPPFSFSFHTLYLQSFLPYCSIKNSTN